MSFSTTDTEIFYTGDGVDSTFAIPFYFTDANSIKLELYDMDLDEPIGVDQVLNVNYTQAGTDVTLVTMTIDPISGDPVYTPKPLLVTERLRVYRESIDYHQVSYNTYQFPYPTVNIDLDRVYQLIQETKREVDRAIKLNALSLENGESLDGEEILAAIAELEALIAALSTGSGLPTGGADGDYIQRAIDPITFVETGVWKTGALSGYSARFNENFSSTSLEDTLNKIINFAYTAPLISLSCSPSQAIREKGTSVAAVTMSATTTRRSDDITGVTHYRNGVLVDTEAAPAAGGGVESFVESTPFTDTMTFYSRVSDGTSTIQSNTVTYSYAYPYYSGAGAVGLSAAAVAALTKDVRASTASLNKSFTAANGNVYYFAYPASYGALTSILDENGFQTFGDWTLRTENITGLDASAQSYRIYEFNNPVVAGTTNYTFIR